MKEQMIPHPDYPRPQFQRKDWLNLNGEWEFEFDDQRVGDQEGWFLSDQPFSRSIQVPFAFQSKLSGIEDSDFHDVVWYRKKISMPEEWEGKNILLHFGAVDYVATVWVNGRWVKSHEGGHTAFQVNITTTLHSGENIIVIKAEDFSRDLSLPRGKQYWQEQSAGIFYTRTTGIWQTVWMEPVEMTYLDKVKLTPNIDTSEIEVRSFFKGFRPEDDVRLKFSISFNGNRVTEDELRVRETEEIRTVKLHGSKQNEAIHLWSPENPQLYVIHFSLQVNGSTVDGVQSYFGMRKISVENGRLWLNNRPYYMRLVLDQGYFPDGNLTPPSNEAIKQDVELSKAMGFNGARKHQKLEDPRYLYWCDQLGLLVWGEVANARQLSEEYIRRFTQEWQEAVDRDYNHPSIVAWVPLNESWGVPNIQRNVREQQHAVTMYHLIKSIDPTRLVISNDGWEHMVTDLCTLHDYQWRQEVLEERYSTLENALSFRPNRGARNIFVRKDDYSGQPILVTEFGGISFKKSDWEGWGYSGAKDEEDFLKRLEAVVQPLLKSPVLQGFCYTQLTDVEQEINGLLTYDRQLKTELEKIRRIISAPDFQQMQYKLSVE